MLVPSGSRHWMGPALFQRLVDLPGSRSPFSFFPLSRWGRVWRRGPLDDTSSGLSQMASALLHAVCAGVGAAPA